MDRMRTRDFSPIDYMGYVLTMWYNGFFNYPFVVRVSIFMILICCISMVFFTISISVNKHFEGRRNRIYNRYYKRFYDIFCEITLNKDKLTRNEIDERIGLTTRDIARRKKPKYMFALCMLLVQVKSDYYNEYNYRNVRTLCNALAIEEFMERMLVFGSRTNRRRALQISQFMMIDLPESVLVRLLNSVNQVIRKETRMYYLWLSDYNPFRFFMESELHNYEWREWDALEIHFLMRARHIANKEMPSLPPIIAECENEKLQACLIREVGYWGTAEDMDNMKKYLAHKSQVVRQATIVYHQGPSGISRAAAHGCLRPSERTAAPVYPPRPGDIQYGPRHTLLPESMERVQGPVDQAQHHHVAQPVWREGHGRV